MRSCNDVMTMDPTCCLVSDPVSRAAEIMKTRMSDPCRWSMMRQRRPGRHSDRPRHRDPSRCRRKGCDDVRVEDVMTRNPVTCKPEEDIQNALDRMSQHQVRRIPVVDGRGRVVGIIAQADLATRMDRPEKVGKGAREHIATGQR